MKLVERTINGINIAINVNRSNEVYFEEDFILAHPRIPEDLTPTNLCEILSEDIYTPLLLSWELLDKCSFSCPFCYIVGHSSNKLVRFSQAKSRIFELIDMGLLHCTLTGGEATLHPDFAEIYQYLKENGVIVEVYTNGSLLNKEHLKLFKQYPPYKVEVSIYGLTQANFNHVTGSSKFSYNEILENVLMLKRNGINVVCKTPLNKITIEEFDAIKDWCAANGVKFYYSTDIFKGYDGQELKSFSISYDQKVKYEAQKIEGLYKTYPNEFEDFLPTEKTCYTCSVKKFGLHINSAFELMPCSETHLAETKSNLLENTIADALLKYRNFVNRFIGRKIIGCTGCEASPICKMCSAKAEPVKDEAGKVTDFKVLESHCETQRKNIRGINDYMIVGGN